MPQLTDGPPVDDPLEEIIHAYFEARQAGSDPDRQRILGAHPSLAADLTRFFADHDRMDRLALPLRDVAQAARVAGAEASSDAPARRLPAPVEFGDYVLLDVLGMGGMGIVYRAHYRKLKRDVALKQILGGPLAHESEVERFRIEAEAPAKLQHPNIVAIHDVGEYQGRHYLTMNLIEGGSLAAQLDRFRDDPLAAARLMTVVAGAVHHAHERGILHRDLKPSNILLDQDGRPHVTDFGLARQIGAESTLTGSGAILGSPPYMAPEQAGGRTKEITTRTDVYGLGAVLYALLTGRPPFRGDSPLETLEQVRSTAPEPPRRLNPRVDRDLETICLKCLEKEPDQRYPSARDVGADLDLWLTGRPIRARRTGWTRRVVLWTRRRPYASAVIAGVVLAFALGFAGILWQWRAAVAARRAMEVALYEDRIALADRELSAGEPGHAMDLLDECDPALRGWEWFHLRHRRPFAEVKLGNQHIITFCVAYHPAGKILATGQGNGTIGIWEARDGGITFVRALKAHDRMIPSLAFTADGRRMVSASHDGTATVWDTTTWTVLSSLRDKPLGGLWCAAIHPDGRRIALAGLNKLVGLWEPETGNLRVFQGHADRVTGVAFHPGGRLLASSSDDATVRLRDVETGREVRVYRDSGLFSFTCVAFSPDGRHLAAGNNGGALTLWETASGREVFRRSRQSAAIRSVAFDLEGRRLATAGGSGLGVTIWDAATGRDILALHGHPGEVWGVAFSADGRRLASSGVGLIREWDAPREGDADSTGGLRVLRGHSERVRRPVVQPGRPAAGHRLLGPVRPCLGPRYRPADPDPARTGRRPDLRRLRPGRPAGRVGARSNHHDLGCRRERGRVAGRPRAERHGPGVQRRRPMAGLGGRRRPREHPGLRKSRASGRETAQDHRLRLLTGFQPRQHPTRHRHRGRDRRSP